MEKGLLTVFLPLLSAAASIADGRKAAVTNFLNVRYAL